MVKEIIKDGRKLSFERGTTSGTQDGGDADPHRAAGMVGGKPIPVTWMYLARPRIWSLDPQRGEPPPTSSAPGRWSSRASSLAGQWRIACSKVSSSSSQKGQVLGEFLSSHEV